MKLRVFLYLFCMCLHSDRMLATTWQVGPARTYTLPSQVSTLVQNGDTVEMDAALYPSDVARWDAANLYLKGAGGFAHLEANGLSYGGKAIWVIAGANVTVENIEFSGCTSPDHNGAGIRMESTPLYVRHCRFHDNENGILTGNDPGKIVVEFSEFDHNGYPNGLAHNLYVGHLDTLEFRFNYSHRSIVGHELKSRATFNLIEYNRISNEQTGSASREMDIPNGGIAIIRGNMVEQGPNSQNSNIIGYGAEGLINPGPHEIYLVNNTLVNDHANGTFVSVQNGTNLFFARNNVFAGPGSVLSGTSQLADTASDLRFSSVSAAGFIDAANFDYHLLPGAPEIDAGINPGNTTGGISLSPDAEYGYPADSLPRNISGNLDVGAFEFITGSGILFPVHSPVRFTYNAETHQIGISGITGECNYLVSDLSGKVIAAGILNDVNQGIQVNPAAGSVLLIRIIAEGIICSGKLRIIQ